MSDCISSQHIPQSELERKREVKQKEREAKDKEARKREKAEEKEKRRKEYNAQMAAAAAREQQKKKTEEKKKKKNGQAAGESEGRGDAPLQGMFTSCLIFTFYFEVKPHWQLFQPVRVFEKFKLEVIGVVEHWSQPSVSEWCIQRWIHIFHLTISCY